MTAVLNNKETVIQPDLTHPLGRKVYNIEGAGKIVVGWRQFQPDVKSSQHNSTHKTIIFIPGWACNERSETIAPLCRAFANYSFETVYALDTRADRIIPHSVLYEAEADRQFLQEKGFRNVIIANSLGGGQAAYLITLLQERNPVICDEENKQVAGIHIEGLILLDSMALYDQTTRELMRNYAGEMQYSSFGLKLSPKFKGSKNLSTQNWHYLREGFFEIIKEIISSHVYYPSRLRNELKEIVRANPCLGDITVPIILIQGVNDMLSQPAKIIPNQEKHVEDIHTSQYIEDIYEREHYLQKNKFKKSPYIRMIVPAKAGCHGLPSFRPQAVARASLYLLERWKRQQDQQPLVLP